MKRILFIFYINFILCFLAACGKQGEFVKASAVTDEEAVSNGEDESDFSESKEVVADDFDGDKESEESLDDAMLNDDDSTDNSEDDNTGGLYAVHVCGAVVNPGVYYLDSDSLKKDALDAAGGFVDGASLEYINLAQHIKDGEQIYFPFEDEVDLLEKQSDDNEAFDDEAFDNEAYNESDSEAKGATDDLKQSSYDASGKLNINRANKEELMTLSGIGEAKAGAIISYRDEHGGFKSIEELKNITGIKDGVYNNIKDFITVD